MTCYGLETHLDLMDKMQVHKTYHASQVNACLERTFNIHACAIPPMDITTGEGKMKSVSFQLSYIQII